jgi:two-component system chemotaxis response regulator CheY
MMRSAAVIEDEEVLRESVAEMLLALGYQADTFEDARRFLQAVDSGATYDLCVVDINLPGMRGDDMLLALGRRNKLRHSVVLFLSGLEEQEVSNASRKVSGYFPAVDYTCKPVRAETLLERIGMLAGAT